MLRLERATELPSFHDYYAALPRLGMWLWAIFTWYIMFWVSHRPDLLAGASTWYVILLFPVFFTAASIFYTMASSAVCVDREGIKWTLFGWTWQFIRWKDITRIREVEGIEPRDQSVVMAYNFHALSKKFPFFVPPITDTISYFETLKQIINENIKPGTVIEYKSKGQKLQRDRI
jgi:hypothetical protein